MRKVFEYDSYTDFLQDYVEFKKENTKHWSLSSWAQELNLSTTSSLSNIIQGRRAPSHTLSKVLATTMEELSDLEKDYFVLLVELFKSEDNGPLRETIQKRMASIRPSRSFRQISEEESAQISNWHSYALREMVNLKDFNRDTSWIVRRLNSSVTSDEVEKSLQCLLKVGLLKEDSSGKLSIASEAFETETDKRSLSLRKYHKSFMSLASVKIETCGVDERHFTGGTICLSLEDLKTAKIFIENTRREFVDTFDRPGGDEVYHFAIQFFPLTGQ